jgi:uncharacterized protein YdeI (YjbR/CyaY-like superfamily)
MNQVPAEFAQALKNAGLSDFFADCTPAHRREYLKWIQEAKKPETRTARIGKAIEGLSSKRAEEEKRLKKGA